MKISRPILLIALDVPGINQIKVVTGDPGAEVWLTAASVRKWNADQIGEVIDALEVAKAELESQNGDSSTLVDVVRVEDTSPRTFRRGDSIPDDVTQVRDYEHDLWYRQPDGRWDIHKEGSTPLVIGNVSYPWSTRQLIDTYGPITEVVTTPTISLRMFAEGDSIPDDVIEVRDSDGDSWCRQDDGLWSIVSRSLTVDDFTTELLLDTYGPVTEVRK